MWEHFPHEADMGVRGVGDDENEAFAEAAKALCALTTELSEVSERERVEIERRAPDVEQLLVEWLDALIFEMATRHMVFARFEVQIEDGTLHGVAWGERRDERRHTAGVEVKGATFTELRVTKDASGRAIAQCVVDV
jgi:SHS2 domain-containing protein